MLFNINTGSAVHKNSQRKERLIARKYKLCVCLPKQKRRNSLLGALIKDSKLRFVEEQSCLAKNSKKYCQHFSIIPEKKHAYSLDELTIPSRCCSPRDKMSSQFWQASHPPSLSKRYNNLTFSRIVFR